MKTIDDLTYTFISKKVSDIQDVKVENKLIFCNTFETNWLPKNRKGVNSVGAEEFQSSLYFSWIPKLFYVFLLAEHDRLEVHQNGNYKINTNR